MDMAKSGTPPNQERPMRAGDPVRTLIRPVETADLAAVATLVRETLHAGGPGSEPALAAFFRRTLIEQPWADPEIPSLVADEDGEIVGFVGAEVRRMRLGDRAMRFAWAAHSVVAPAARARAVGFALTQRLLDGPQDATLGDSASPLVEQMWLRLGGRRLELKGIHWVRVFRPASVAARLGAPRRARLRAGVRRLAGRLDDLTSWLARSAIAPRTTTAADEALTPQAMVDAMPRVGRRLGLHPDYDEAFLDWLFGELPRVKDRGELVAQLVRDARRRPVGWYVYFLQPGWRSEVLQVAATGERALGTVLDQLLAHAYAHGSAAVRGRLEPGMLCVVAQRRCLLWHRGAAVAHSRDPGVLDAIERPNALVSRLDGDPWVDTLVDAIR
jgi:hypothetical protein